MKDFFSRRWLVIILVAILISLVTGIFSSLSGGRVSPVSNMINILTTPIQKGISTTSNSVHGFFARMTEYEEIKGENKDLKDRLSSTEKQLRDAQRAIAENEQLRAALELKKRGQNFQFEPAEIIARGNDNLSATFTIDKGTMSGIAVDNCVVTVDGMVGYISEVGTNWAVITAVTDTAMEASAVISRTRDVASAEGDFDLMKQGRLKLSYLEKDAQLVRGDTVETSGLGGLFPKGIVLGTVEDVRSESHGITKYAVIKPAVDLGRVNHVLVIRSFQITE